MGYLFNGDRITDFVSGVTPVTAQWLNEIQDQLKVWVGPRWLWIPLLPTYVSPTAISPHWEQADGHLDGGNQNSSIARFPVSFIVEGMRITNTKCVLAGAAGVTAGSAYLRRYNGAGAMIAGVSMKGASAWPVAGIGFANAVELAGAAVDHTMTAGEYCVVEVNFPSNQSTNEGEVWGLAVKVQMDATP